MDELELVYKLASAPEWIGAGLLGGVAVIVGAIGGAYWRWR